MSQSSQKLYVTSKTFKQSRYHTNKNCVQLKNSDIKEVDEEYVQWKELKLCSECDKEEYRENTYHLKYHKKYIDN